VQELRQSFARENDIAVLKFDGWPEVEYAPGNRPFMNRYRAAFTLIELLVVVAIIGILATLLMVAGPGVLERGRQTASLNNMRQVGMGFQLYANDNDMRLPNRVQTGDRWPKLLQPYLHELKVYADPSDSTNFLIKKTDPLSNGPNNTSYMMNGFNDVGAFSDENINVRLNALDKPSDTALLGPEKGHAHFYMDFDEGNQNDVLKKDAFNGGSNYLFADGSVKFVKKTDYDDRMWLVHKDSPIP
jgi:prepilin-type N-terminal cleavage/methylation domain-containing protein/prepilin-type processing-associated H-X9-DG protein